MTRQFVLQGAHSPGAFACHLIAVGLAVLLVVVLSRYERQLISRKLGFTLLSLRLAMLAIILMTLLQPTLSWTMEHKRIGRILVGIDLSESMETVDQHATSGEKLRVARGLELIGTDAQQERLDQWQKAFDANDQPQWVDADESSDEKRRVALESSRRSHLQTIFKEVEKLKRSEIARRLVNGTKQTLIEQLNQAARVELFVFAGKSETVDAESLAKVVQAPSETLLTDRTDLSLGLQRAASESGDVLGIVLFTDGRDHSDQNLSSMASALKATNSPVYPVMVGSSFRPRDLSIALLEHPATVYKEDHPQLKVTLSTFGFEGQEIVVELVPEDKPDAEPIRQVVKPTGNSATVEFDLEADEIGRKSYIVRTPVLEGETRDDNNSRTFSFSVVDDRARVLLVDGEARWEFRYLEAALSRDDRVDLKTILFSQPYMGILPEPFFPQRLILPPDPTDLAASPFAEIDLVIIGDVAPDQFTDTAWQLLQRFVSEGGTVVLSAGARYMPLAHRSPALEQLMPITKVLPVNLADKTQEAPPTQRGLPLKLTADGELLPMLQFAGDVAQNVALWKGLPGQTFALLGEAKPSATVWATTMVPAGRIEGLNVDRKYGVLVHQFVGSGQVVWIGIDATWRWRHRVGDKFHHRFWGQLARWAAANKLDAGTEFVRFGAEKSEIERGDDARLRARWTRSFLQKFPKLKARADLFRRGDNTDKPFTSVELVPSVAKPLQQEGRAVSLPAGEYLARLTAAEANLGDKPIETTIFVRDKPSLELSDLSTNRDLLAKIADASGGRLFLPDEVHDQLPKMFKKVEESITQYEEVSLWDRWPWLVLLFAFMTCEWVLRKLNGLP